MAPVPKWTGPLVAGVGLTFVVAAIGGPVIASARTGPDSAPVAGTSDSGWRIHPGGQIGATTWGEFSVVGPDDAWVAGSFTPGDDGGSKVAHWDGERWSEVKGAPGYTYAIEAVAADDVWAMSGYATREDVIEHWNGERWKAVDVPAKPGSDADQITTFEDSYASAPDDIWAVGSVEVGLGESRTETVHWNGERWRWVPSPSYDDSEATFTAVSGTAADDVWAVGYSISDSDHETAITAHWNGADWQRVELPELPKNARLTAIAARSPEAVWAVGEADEKPLALYYDGTEWRPVSSTPTGEGELTGIAPDGNGGLWAVYNKWDDDNFIWPTPYFLHWNGERWDRTKAPGGEGGIYGIALVPGTRTLWAGGTQAGASEDIPDNSLIDRYGPLPG